MIIQLCSGARLPAVRSAIVTRCGDRVAAHEARTIDPTRIRLPTTRVWWSWTNRAPGSRRSFWTAYENATVGVRRARVTSLILASFWRGRLIRGRSSRGSGSIAIRGGVDTLPAVRDALAGVLAAG